MTNWYKKYKPHTVDLTINKKAQSRKINIVLFQGSARHTDNCPDQWGKTRKFLEYAKSNIKDVNFEVIDLSVNPDDIHVKPCKACVSTAGGFHCHWYCSCYMDDESDLMYQQDVYGKLERCDGFMVFSPVNWYSVSSVVKSCFDRLVCANLTLTAEEAKSIFDGDIKNAQKTKAAEKSGQYNHLLKNHLEGKIGAFFIHGDNGAADYQEFTKEDEAGKQNVPLTYDLSDNQYNIVNDPKISIAPIVCQCRYSGIEVPDDLIFGKHLDTGEGYSYAEGNENVEKGKTDGFKEAKEILQKLVQKIKEKSN